MPYLVSYEIRKKDIATVVSDDRAALRLAAAFEAQGLAGVAIRDSSGAVLSPMAFRLLHAGAVDGLTDEKGALSRSPRN